ncbi:hypothetical protein ACH4UM_31570 [Streptomyces sp. NPDC020801]|uniref:hypothetical protein n=1 Tax=Streptomyces sp. NPDC020801 TaxID=3365093 RepID=UPI0037B41A38
MPNIKARLAAMTGAAALTAGLLVAGAGPASAAEDDFHFELQHVGGNTYINVFNDSMDGRLAGWSGWWADPGTDGSPGDTLEAYDNLADGYGIEAHLSTGRTASTRGHSAKYQDTASGNLPEGHKYQMWVCVVKGSWSKCSGKEDVWA